MSRREYLQPRRGDIFYADLRDMGSDSQRGFRPVIVIQNNIGNANGSSVIVAAITSSRKKRLPTHVQLGPQHGLKQESTAVLEDILTIDKSHLSNYLGTVVNTKAEQQLNQALRISLGI